MMSFQAPLVLGSEVPHLHMYVSFCCSHEDLLGPERLDGNKKLEVIYILLCIIYILLCKTLTANSQLREDFILFTIFKKI